MLVSDVLERNLKAHTATVFQLFNHLCKRPSSWYSEFLYQVRSISATHITK
jgi:hypothetical protein